MVIPSENFNINNLNDPYLNIYSIFVIHLDYGNSKKIMKEIYTNIHIIGGGLIGLATAYCLSKLSYNIVVSDKKSTFADLNNKDDNRTVAISEGTKNFLEELGVWKSLYKNSEQIKEIKVVDRNFTNNLVFENKRSKSNLGYIIKNKTILKKIYLRLKSMKNVTFISNSNVCSIDYKNNYIYSKSNVSLIKSDLIIAADGKNSKVRNIIKTPLYKKNYNQSALVVCFTHKNSHNNTAYEFFYKNGPLAILPMKKESGNFCSSIVWSNDADILNQLMSIDESELINILNEKIHQSVGKVKKIFSKNLFPLTSHLNSKFYDKRLIYVGDSAHSIHPIAGQGWNLGMRDVKKIFEISKKYHELGIDLGGLEFCKKYNDKSYYDAYQLYQITDKLDYIFKLNKPPFLFIRSLGFDILNKNDKIKNLISDFAMGV